MRPSDEGHAERPGAATLVLARSRGGDAAAHAQLTELVYAELRGLAGRYLSRLPKNHTLWPTELVHEAFVRLVGAKGSPWRDRAHFRAVCAVAMRGILADHVRRKRAAKRGGGWERVSLTDAPAQGAAQFDVVALDDALRRLAAINARLVRVVECRFFAGMTIEETAAVLGVSRTTVDDDWRMARAWLSAELTEGPLR